MEAPCARRRKRILAPHFISSCSRPAASAGPIPSAPRPRNRPKQIWRFEQVTGMKKVKKLEEIW
jgi:hypothetical protein